jgi:LPXTG-site transpeptidase (sortase) family protein
MRNRRSNTKSRWIAAPVIIVGAVITFLISQHRQSVLLPSQIPAPTFDLQSTIIASPTTKSVIFSQLWITSDRAKLTAPIRDLYYAANGDWDVSLLGLYAGHLEGTPAIGLGGNYVLAGHVELKDGKQGPFAELQSLQIGDKLTIHNVDSQKPFVVQYVVTEIKHVQPNDVEVVRNHGYEELTLITCESYDFASNTYNSRLVIHSRPTRIPPNLVTLNPS